jgi:hypothetical protein
MRSVVADIDREKQRGNPIDIRQHKHRAGPK